MSLDAKVAAWVLVWGMVVLVGCQSPQAQARREVAQEIAARQEGFSRAEQLFRQAIEDRREGRLVEARQRLREAVGSDNRHAPAWIALGAVEHEHGRFYEAAEAFHRAARLLPGRYEPRYNLGMVFQAAGHHAKAIVEYEAALEMAPDQAEVMENLARCYIRTNQKLDRAKDLIDRALTIETRAPWLTWLSQQQLALFNRLQRRTLSGGGSDSPDSPHRAAPRPPTPATPRVTQIDTPEHGGADPPQTP